MELLRGRGSVATFCPGCAVQPGLCSGTASRSSDRAPATSPAQIDAHKVQNRTCTPSLAGNCDAHPRRSIAATFKRIRRGSSCRCSPPDGPNRTPAREFAPLRGGVRQDRQSVMPARSELIFAPANSEDQPTVTVVTFVTFATSVATGRIRTRRRKPCYQGGVR